MTEIPAVLATVLILNVLVGLVMTNVVMIAVGLVAGAGLLLWQVWA